MAEPPSSWKAPVCGYTIEGDSVTTDRSVAWRITGTSIGALLGCSPYATPFTASARLLGLWDEDISAKPAVIAGKMLEERIIDYLASGNTGLGTFLKAEDLFNARTGAHSDWKSDFDDEVFAGHVDGIVSRDGQDYILEIKTTSRRAFESGAWDGHPPEHYLWQVYLYNHFITGQDKAYFGVGILDEDVYQNPNLWVPNRSNCRIYEVSIDRAAVAAVIENLRTTYGQTVAQGIPFPYNPDRPDDVRLMTHLKDMSGDMGHLNEVVAQWKAVKEANDAYEKANLANLKLEDELKDRVKVMMLKHNLHKAGPAVMRTTYRRSFDFRKADSVGFDYAEFVTETPVNTMMIKE